MNTYRLKVSTPEGLKFDGEAERIVVRAALGDLAILADHVPMMTTIRPGTCRVVDAEGRTIAGHTEGGILTVGKESVIALLGSWTIE
ncbi:MAG: hypothetical protein IKP10_07825 [Clostridia bacterium]|nr:hypothetical protein [Clostridia bacterium]